MKILPVGVEFFYADRRTDRHDEANSHFPQFWEGTSKLITRSARPMNIRILNFEPIGQIH